MICHFSNMYVHFIFCQLNFHCTFSISYKILTNYVYYYFILIMIILALRASFLFRAALNKCLKVHICLYLFLIFMLNNKFMNIFRVRMFHCMLNCILWYTSCATLLKCFIVCQIVYCGIPPVLLCSTVSFNTPDLLYTVVYLLCYFAQLFHLIPQIYQ